MTTAPAFFSWQTTALNLLRRSMVFLVLIALAYYFDSETGRFLQDRNLRNVAQQNVHILIVTVGMTLVMLSGGIDLSVGSIAALGGAISAGLIVNNGLTFEESALATLAMGFGLGLINGGLVVFGKLPPFAATLSMMGVARGLTLLYTNNKPISIASIDKYTYWRRESFNLPFVGETPVSILIAVGVLILAILLLTRTRYGLHIYAVGGNEETARLAGVSVNRVKLLTYALSGMLAALAGMILTARVYSAQPRSGVGLELEAIASAVLGGVSLFGGVGNIPNVVVGGLLVGVLGNGMNLMRIESYQQDMIKGIVLVAAVTIDMYTKRFENTT
jgi:ribose transport system permease protein